MNTIETIRAEVLRLMKESDGSQWGLGKMSACNRILNFLDTIQEHPVKVGDKVSIIKKKEGIVTRISDGKARVETGDTMEIVNLSDLVTEQPVCDDLESYAQKVEDYYDVGEERGYLCVHRGEVKDAVIAGAKWQKEQMMKEAVEGEVKHFATVHYVLTNEDQLTARLKQFQDGDKVHIFIVKEEQK